MNGSQRRSLRGFSLIELLLAVFILGIGVISIAALFPAGIAQQRQSVDDIIGPIVANNALAVLRNKLRPEDFGTFEEFGLFPPQATIEGDWPWLRPAFIFGSPAIDIFNATGLATADEFAAGGSPFTNGLPYNSLLYDFNTATPNPEPVFLITQGERYYPMRSLKPQYVWECMFRRFQGKVFVAIFVYRVRIPGGGSVSYAVADDGTLGPPLPFSLDLTTTPSDPWDAKGNPVIPGTDPGTPFNLYDPSAPAQNQGWQAPAQWLLDQNNNVHRVLAGRGSSSDGPVELVRPVSSMPLLPVYFLPAGTPVDDVVTNIWYIPPVDSNGLTLTPVYVTVREL